MTTLALSITEASSLLTTLESSFTIVIGLLYRPLNCDNSKAKNTLKFLLTFCHWTFCHWTICHWTFCHWTFGNWTIGQWSPPNDVLPNIRDDISLRISNVEININNFCNLISITKRVI